MAVRKHSYKNQDGQILLLSIILMLAITIMGVSMLGNARKSASASTNIKNRAQAFYASDAIMTLLTQEILDGHEGKYLGSTATLVGTSVGSLGDPSTGSYQQLDEMHIIRSSGSDIWGTADHGYFAYIPLSGDVDIKARVVGLTGTNLNVWAKAGIMLRSSLNNNAINIFGCITPGNGVSRQYRSSLGASSNYTNKTGYSCPIWLRMKRTGNIVTLYMSHDGSAWTDSMSPVTINLGTGIYAGLAVTSHDNSNLCIGSFDRVEGLVAEESVQGTGTWVVDNYNVDWTVQRTSSGGLTITTDAYKDDPLGNKMFSAPLQQHLERGQIGGYPPVQWQKVVLYDYHYVNNDFNNCLCKTGSAVKGMVTTTLSSERKPVYAGTASDLNCTTPPLGNPCSGHISSWFEPSSRGAGIQFRANSLEWTGLVPVVTKDSHYDSAGWVSPSWCNGAWANIVYYDSLPFQRIGDSATGTYEYTNDAYFPLQNKGFYFTDTLYEPGTGQKRLYPSPQQGLNYSFTMEMHCQFTYRGGEKFKFKGDDDVWVFLNGSLAIDIGGIHAYLSDSVALDDFAATHDMHIGHDYWFDFFFAERHITDSHCRITTNLDLFRSIEARRNWRRDYGRITY